MAEAFIYDHVRTPRGKGRANGALHEVTALELATQALRSLRDRSELDTSLVDDVIFGCVAPVNEQGADIARTAVLNADYAETVAGVQINRFCASGLEATNIAAAKVMSGEADFAIGGGVEAMSRVPMGSDGGAWPTDPSAALKTYFVPQGISADLIATKYGFSRTDVDAFAVESQKRAAKSWAEKRFARSIVPVKDQLGQTLLDRDEHMRPETTMQSLASLEPAFSGMGDLGFDSVAIQKYPAIEAINHVHHAGNSSGIVDGAAGVLVGSKKAGRSAGITPRARIRATASIGSEPSIMLTGPEFVTVKVLKKAGMTKADIDLWELNEAFAAVVLRYMQAMDIPHEKINVCGGAIAMGHPLGATGAMILGTVLDELERTNKTTALVTLCIGAGMGTATIIERVDPRKQFRRLTKMKMENFKWEKDEAGIVTITWDMPGRSMNVLSTSSLRDIGAWVAEITKDASIKGVVLTSGKPAFCAGADLAEMEGNAAATSDAAVDPAARMKRMVDGVTQVHQLLRTIETCGKPVVAAINGTALGGGLEVTLACHHRIVSDNPKTQLGLPEAKVGVMPGGGGTQRLPRMMGAGAALPLILEGKTLDPQAALKAGLVGKVVPQESLISEAKRWIKESPKTVQPWDEKGFRVPGGGPYDKSASIVFTMGNAMLRKQSFGNYPAQINIMKAVYEGLQVPIDAALRIETRYFVDVLSRPESKAMVRSLFLSMQELGKGARRPKGVPESKVKKLGVLGAGVMGAGIAYVSALAGIEVVLIDRDQAAADKGKDYSAKVLDKDIARGRATDAKKTELLSRIRPTPDYAALAGCDLVIEAVFEDRALKADVTKKAEAVIPPTSIFASNTSTLPIGELGQASQRPESFIGIHFFSPVERMGLVEIIVSKKTSETALARAIDYVAQIRKTPIVVNDKRGFYTSRCFSTYTGEGLRMLSEGIHPALIENAGRMAGMPMGPLEVLDSVGNDTPLKIIRAARKDLDIAEPDDGEKLISWLVEDNGRLGRKSSKGFYDYDDKGKRGRIWPDLIAKRAGGWNSEADVEELKKRFLYAQALESARCFEENVVTDPRDADVGSILGWGFAPFTGGTISFIDMVGPAKFVKECEKLAKTHGERFKPNKLLRDLAKSGETFYGRFKAAKSAA